VIRKCPDCLFQSLNIGHDEPSIEAVVSVLENDLLIGSQLSKILDLLP
jgi:hypothetical protein